MFYVQKTERGFDLIDGDFLSLYADQGELVAITDEQYQELQQKRNELTQFDFEKKEFIYQEKVISATEQADYFAALKQTKLAEINNKAQAFVTAQARLNEVPDFEIQTWEQQRVEALAWSDDQAVETPILAAIAEARGIDLDTLRAAALRKAQAFSLLSAHIAGQRQALVDRLNQATTVEEVDAIEVGFSKPTQASAETNTGEVAQ